MYVILFCDVIFSPLPTAPRGWGRKTTPWVGLKTVHVHDTGTSGVMTSLPVGKNAANLHAFTIMTSLPVCDVTSVPGPSIHNYLHAPSKHSVSTPLWRNGVQFCTSYTCICSIDLKFQYDTLFAKLMKLTCKVSKSK